jgi:hypothetical protein
MKGMKMFDDFDTEPQCEEFYDDPHQLEPNEEKKGTSK